MRVKSWSAEFRCNHYTPDWSCRCCWFYDSTGNDPDWVKPGTEPPAPRSRYELTELELLYDEDCDE